LLDIDDAIESTVAASPGALNLGESEAGPSTQTVTLTNTGDATVTYALSYEDAVTTSGDPNNPSFSYAPSRVQLPAQVSVGAGQTATFQVTIAPNTRLDLAQYGGYLVLTPGEGEPLRIPYAGFAGDYQSLPLMTDIGHGLPTLSSL